jgi:hypothetical protein
MSAIVQKIRTLRFFKRANNLDTPWQIILWWEIRRIPFNLIVGIVGIFTLIFLFALEMLLKNDFLDEVLPDPPMIAIFGYGILANICFTGGWVAELFARKTFKEESKNFGEILFFFGLTFSVVLTLLPILIYLLILVTHR